MPLRSTILCVFLALLPTGLWAQSATFEVFDDPSFTQRTGVMTGQMKTLYVQAVADVFPPGYTGFEFRLTGLEDFIVTTLDWTVEPVLVLGTLADGMNVAWPSCQLGESVLAFTIFSLNPPQDREIRVAAHTNPSNPNLDFPYLNGCDAPCIWCGAILEGEAYFLNPSGNVAVESTQWTSIKRLYR